MRRKQAIYLHRKGSARSLPSNRFIPTQNVRRRARKTVPAALLVVAALALLGGVAVFANNKLRRVSPPVTVKPQTVKAVPTPIVPAPSPVILAADAAFAREANEIIARYSSYRISVSVHDFATAKDVQVGSKERFRAASTAKLITATDYMSKVEAGTASLDTLISGVSAREHLRRMLVNSDNVSWNVVNEYMTLPDLTAYASRSLGIQGYDRPANMLHSDETNGILTRLYGGKLLNKANTDYLLSLMKQANYRSYIVPSVPSGYTIYHKAGFYLGHEHDAAIIVRTGDNKAISLTIYTYGGTTTVASPTRTKAFAELTTAAITSYFP